MFSEKFLEVLQSEGVVSIVSWGNDEPHINNTWISYLQVKEGNKLLVPAAGFTSTQKDIEVNDKVKVTLGCRDVEGLIYKGTGFALEGTAKFLDSGVYFDEMKEKFPFLTRVLEITVTSSKQTL